MNEIVLALGFFDGIHLGHTALLKRTVERGRELSLPPAVFTFDCHPRQVITGQPMPLINCPDDRRDLLARLFGIERLCICHFDQQMMHLACEDFPRFLQQEYRAAHVVAGHDFRFGYQNRGTPELLQRLCAGLGIGCDIIPCVRLDGVTVSSTLIRQLLLDGDMEQANRFLGHPYGFSAVVQHGQRLGSRLGMPTINLPLAPDTLIPAYGVYVSRAFLPDGRCIPAVTNIGTRPTVGGTQANAESFLLDFSGDLYGVRVRLELFRRLRNERKFPSPEELGQQVQQDCALARSYFAAHPELCR